MNDTSRSTAAWAAPPLAVPGLLGRSAEQAAGTVLDVVVIVPAIAVPVIPARVGRVRLQEHATA